MRKAQDTYIQAIQGTIDAFGNTPGQQGVSDLTKKMAAQNAEWGKLFGGAGGFDTPGTFKDSAALRAWVESMKQWSETMTGPARAAWDSNIEMFQGWLDEWEKSILKFGDSLSDVTLKQSAYNKLFNVKDTPGQKITDSFSVLNQMAPELMRKFGLSGLNTGSQAGRNTLTTGLQDIYKLIESGGLSAELLGQFTDKNQLLQSILAVKDAMDGLATVTTRLTTDIPKAINLALYERMYGSGVGADGAGSSSALPADPGLIKPPGTKPPAEGGDTYVITIQGSDKTASQLFDEISVEAKRRKAAGGRVVIGDTAL